jgi:hypothetical protein
MGVKTGVLIVVGFLFHPGPPHITTSSKLYVQHEIKKIASQNWALPTSDGLVMSEAKLEVWLKPFAR